MARRHDVDWLRVLLFGLLVLHHTAVGFAPFGASIYGFVNDELGGPLVSLLIYWSHTWRLPALFLIAGLGTWFATSRSYGIDFLGRRLARLLAESRTNSRVRPDGKTDAQGLRCRNHSYRGTLFDARSSSHDLSNPGDQ